MITTGEISDVDLGRLTRPGQEPAYFAHAATAGMNVNFAKLATRASVRARLGRLTYLAAALYTLREPAAFTCTLRHDGVTEDLTLLQLSVITAPVLGGSLGLTVRGRHSEDALLDVLAVEDVPPRTLLRAGVLLLRGSDRQVAGVRVLHLETLGVVSDEAFGLALDGEPAGTLPGEFERLRGAVRVITPRDS